MDSTGGTVKQQLADSGLRDGCGPSDADGERGLRAETGNSREHKDSGSVGTHRLDSARQNDNHNNMNTVSSHVQSVGGSTRALESSSADVSRVTSSHDNNAPSGPPGSSANSSDGQPTNNVAASSSAAAGESKEKQPDSPGASSPDRTALRDERNKGVPSCLVSTRDAAEACSHRAQAWAEEQELKSLRRQQLQRERADGGVRIDEATGGVIEPKGDGIAQRRGMVVVVSFVLAWVYAVFVWRICVRAIHQDYNATATRAEGVGLLVGFHVLWLMAIWAYTKVFTTGPGFVRDHLDVSDPPPSPEEQSASEAISARQPVHEPTPNEKLTSDGSEKRLSHDHIAEGEISSGRPKHAKRAENVQSNTGAHEAPLVASPTGPAQEDDGMRSDENHDVDPSLPAAVGPVGAAIAAQRDEASVAQQQIPAMSKSHAAAPDLEAGQPVGAASDTRPPLPEPMRLPPENMPLHPTNMYCYRCRRIKPPRAHHCRHCGTCVLKMDHHCPWVGGCVGAGNHKFFFNFLQWVTLLEVFVLIVNAYLFARGMRRRSGGQGSAGWPIDGYMISLFPITASFTLFTIALLITHSYLFIWNLSTIEHMGYSRLTTRESIAVDRFLDDRSRTRGEAKLEWIQRTREGKRLRQTWADFWGDLKTETNPWWLDGRRHGPIVGVQTKGENAARSITTGQREMDALASSGDSSDIMARVAWWQAASFNWRENMGDNCLGWILPIGRARNAKGTAYELNWRFGPQGQWTPRWQWPERLQRAREGQHEIVLNDTTSQPQSPERASAG